MPVLFYLFFFVQFCPNIIKIGLGSKKLQRKQELGGDFFETLCTSVVYYGCQSSVELLRSTRTDVACTTASYGPSVYHIIINQIP